MNEISDENRPKLTDRAVLFGVPLIVAIHLAVVLPLAHILNIWSDEASTLFTTEHGLFRTFSNVFADEKQAPFYFLALSVWREIDSSIFFARIFSVVFSVGAIIVFFRLASRHFAARTALLLTGFFGLHPYLIWASLEIRVYSMVIFLSVALLACFDSGFLDDDEKENPTAKVLFVVTAIVAIYANYFLGFTLAGGFVALLILRRWRAAKSYLWLMIIVGIALIPLLWMLKLQFAVVSGDVISAPSLGEGLRLIWNSALTFVLPTEIFPPENITIVSFIRLWIVRVVIIAAAVTLLFRRKIDDKNLLAYGSVCAVIAAFLLFAYFLIGHIYLELRHAAVLFPPLVLTSALVIRELSARWKFISPKRSAIVAILIILPLFVYSTAWNNREFVKRGDWAHVAEFVHKREKPGQPIIVFPAYDVLNVPYYYRGPNRVLPDERFFGWGYEAEYGSAASRRAQISFVISKIPADAQEIWLLTRDECDLTKACEPLENFVAANYTIVEEQYFFHERVRLLRKRQK